MEIFNINDFLTNEFILVFGGCASVIEYIYKYIVELHYIRPTSTNSMH